MIKTLTIAIAIIAVIVVMTAGQVYAKSAYQSGYRNGCADHIRGSPYFVLSINPQYSQGYQDGYAKCG